MWGRNAWTVHTHTNREHVEVTAAAHVCLHAHKSYAHVRFVESAREWISASISVRTRLCECYFAKGFGCAFIFFVTIAPLQPFCYVCGLQRSCRYNRKQTQHTIRNQSVWAEIYAVCKMKKKIIEARSCPPCVFNFPRIAASTGDTYIHSEKTHIKYNTTKTPVHILGYTKPPIPPKTNTTCIKHIVLYIQQAASRFCSVTLPISY